MKKYSVLIEEHITYRVLVDAENEDQAAKQAEDELVNCDERDVYIFGVDRCEAGMEEICEHDKGITDYCQPCGRINNA